MLNLIQSSIRKYVTTKHVHRMLFHLGGRITQKLEPILTKTSTICNNIINVIGKLFLIVVKVKT